MAGSFVPRESPPSDTLLTQRGCVHYDLKKSPHPNTPPIKVVCGKTIEEGRPHGFCCKHHQQDPVRYLRPDPSLDAALLLNLDRRLIARHRSGEVPVNLLDLLKA